MTQFFAIKPQPILSRNKTHKNLQHPIHLPSSFASLYDGESHPMGHRSIANIPSKYRRMQRDDDSSLPSLPSPLSLSFSLSTPREG